MIKCDLCIGTLGFPKDVVGLPTIGIQVSINQNQIFKTLNNAELKLNSKGNKSLVYFSEILRNTYKNISFLKNEIEVT